MVNDWSLLDSRLVKRYRVLAKYAHSAGTVSELWLALLTIVHAKRWSSQHAVKAVLKAYPAIWITPRKCSKAQLTIHCHMLESSRCVTNDVMEWYWTVQALRLLQQLCYPEQTLV